MGFKYFKLILISFCWQFSFATTWTVTNTNDSGAGSLRTAITSANASTSADIIQFNLGAAGPYTIALTSELPIITRTSGSLLINGWENGTNDGTPNAVEVFNATTGTPMNFTYKVILSGSGGTYFKGIQISGSNITVQGIVFKSFDGSGASYNNNKAIYITGNNNSILGCVVGLDYDGVTAGGAKTGYGIEIEGSGNAIGNGTAAGANLISGLYYMGIRIQTATATNNTIKGNMIGPQKDGISLVTYTSGGPAYGVVFDNAIGTGNTIGGTTSGEGNVVSGNFTSGGAGIYLLSPNAVSVLGNIIGPAADGVSLVSTTAQGNGIMIVTASHTIGGSSSGARNIISGNGNAGIYMSSTVSSVSIKGNYIGPNKNGTAEITGHSQEYGIRVGGTANGLAIGGTAAGEGNLISGNLDYGIYYYDATITTSSNVYGNIIGPQVDGDTYLSNSQDRGISIRSSDNINIGSSSAGAKNTISGNNQYGIYIQNVTSTCDNISIKGNHIGINKTGNAIPTGLTTNQGNGINVAANNNTISIGGSAAGEGNVISANVTGIFNAANSTTVQGNIIGLQSDGITNVSSNTQSTGIQISTANTCTIGGTTALQRNIISGNTLYGIYISGTCSNNIIKGNYIGPASDLSNVTGDTQTKGVYAATGVISNTTIGGTAAADANIIAYNSNNGIELRGTTGGNKDYNTFRRNAIYSNGANAISLGGPGNESKASPVIVSWSTTLIEGTTTGASDIIELFKNSTSAAAEDATTYLGMTTASASMNGGGTYDWSFTPSSPTVSVGEFLVATATNTSGSTSQLGKISSPVTLPVELLYFNANCFEGKTIISWETASETNNDYFTIKRTSDGVNNTESFIIPSKGNGPNRQTYTFEDNLPFQGINYYQLSQTDFDGTTKNYNIIHSDCNNSNLSDFNFSIYPNPSINSDITLSFNASRDKEILVVLYDIFGKEHFSKVILNQSNILITSDELDKLARGTYLVVANNNEDVLRKKLVLQ